jgi:hypothetical protein
MIKVFEVSEDEWVAAESAEQAAAYYKQLVGQVAYDETTEEWGDPVELSDEILNRLKWTDDEVMPARTITFAERLAEICATTAPARFPQYFATGNL